MAMLTESVGRKRRATAVGTFYSIAPTLASAGPILGGLVYEKHGFKPLFLIGSLLLFVVTCIRAGLLKEIHRPTSSHITERALYPAFI